MCREGLDAALGRAHCRRGGTSRRLRGEGGGGRGAGRGFGGGWRRVAVTGKQGDGARRRSKVGLRAGRDGEGILLGLGEGRVLL
jgi:hypothetical protein